MKTKTVRITKKQQHINSLQHDLEFCQEHSGASAPMFSWWQGVQRSKGWFMKTAVQIEIEINKINKDKTYKPWNL